MEGFDINMVKKTVETRSYLMCCPALFCVSDQFILHVSACIVSLGS